jgi:hypothetical protein
MFVRHRTWRSSSFLATALAMWGQSPSDSETDAPLQLAHVLRLSADGPDAVQPGEEMVLGLTTSVNVANHERLIVWERLESHGNEHTLYLRGGVVGTQRAAEPEAKVVFRPQAPGQYRIVDDGTGAELHRFSLPLPA